MVPPLAHSPEYNHSNQPVDEQNRGNAQEIPVVPNHVSIYSYPGCDIDQHQRCENQYQRKVACSIEQLKLTLIRFVRFVSANDDREENKQHHKDSSTFSEQ